MGTPPFFRAGRYRAWYAAFGPACAPGPGEFVPRTGTGVPGAERFGDQGRTLLTLDLHGVGHGDQDALGCFLDRGEFGVVADPRTNLDGLEEPDLVQAVVDHHLRRLGYLQKLRGEMGQQLQRQVPVRDGGTE